MGNVELCKILVQAKSNRIASKVCDRFETEEQESVSKETAEGTLGGASNSFWNSNLHHSSKLRTDRMWRFLNACDTFGNTAMHMAVIHSRKEVVDWLMSTQGRDSVNTLNFDGFTPLTLAARHGYVEMFHHILYTHMSKVAWKYGKVLHPILFTTSRSLGCIPCTHVHLARISNVVTNIFIVGHASQMLSLSDRCGCGRRT